jgi:glycosyltransferase involved in cell wall biosynthesis
MRIAFDYQKFCAQPYGGITRYFTRLAERLLQLGQEVGVFAPIHLNQYVRALPPSVVHGYGLPRYLPRTEPLMMMINQWISKNSIRRWQPNIVHETYFARQGSAPHGCPTVLTVYDMIHEKFKELFPATDSESRLKRLSIERADHIICISNNTRKDLLEIFNIDEGKVSVVHLGLEQIRSFNSSRTESMQINRPYLLYVGSRGPYKNFQGLLKALASSKRLRDEFDLVAFGSSALTSTEKNLIAELKFRDNQIRHVTGSDEVLGKLYAHAMAYILPSLYEGFGLPPLEAMLHNCPVISSNTSSMPEVIGNAAEYFDPISNEQMANAIERVVFSPTRAEELVKAGQVRHKLFTWEQCAKKTMHIYHKINGGL